MPMNKIVIVVVMATTLAMRFSTVSSARRLRPSNQHSVITGTIAIVLSPLPGGTDGEVYYLQADDGTTYRLAFCDRMDLSNILPNALATVSYSSVSEGVIHTCSAPVVEQGRGRRLSSGAKSGTPVKPTLLVYLVTMCGYNVMAAGNKNMVYDLFTGSGSNDGRTLASYYNTCSYGKVKLKRSQVSVVGPVQIPCSGALDPQLKFNISNKRFESLSCGNENHLKWHFYMDEIAAKEGIVAADYHHKILVLPEGFTKNLTGCNSFSGLATIGPVIKPIEGSANTFGTGLVWVAGDTFLAGDLEAIMHELGHNYGMAHADVPCGCFLGDLCDHTCTMGAWGGQGIRCLNAPHNWQLGWGQPLARFNDDALGIGIYRKIRIPPQLSTPYNMLIIDSKNLTENNKLYIAARINTPPYDLPYVKAQDGQPFVVVHSYNGTEEQSYFRTVHLADVALGGAYVHEGSGIVVSFTSWDSSRGANVTICRRKGSKEETCGDDLDDDCDMLPDILDPDCRGRTTRGG